MPTILFPTDPSGGEGDTELAVEGTGDAIPRGLEAVFSYNGLTLNNTAFIDKYRLTGIDGLGDADIRDSRQDAPAEHGEITFESFYGGRTIVLNGRIEAYTLSKLRDMHVALRTAFVDLDEKPLYWLTGDVNKDHFINVKKNASMEIGEQQEHQNHFFRNFQISLRASNPRIYRNQFKSYTIYPNEVSNFSFEVDTIGWTQVEFGGDWTSTVFDRQNGWASKGTWSLRMTGTKANDATADVLYATTPTGLDAFPILPSTTYKTFSDVNVLDAPDDGVQAHITWYNSGGASLSVSSGTAITGTGEFTITASGISPSNAAFASVQIAGNSDLALDTADWYIDNVWLVQGDPVLPGETGVDNTGNVEAEPLIKIHGHTSGTIAIYNDTTEEQFKLKDDVIISDGDYYLADRANKTLTDSIGTNRFGHLDDVSDWPYVARGNNSFRVDGGFVGEANSKVEITFRDSYI
jgi:hypothetical protein